MAQQPNLLTVDWSKIPAPVDDGAAQHLTGSKLPDVLLPSTSGVAISLLRLRGRSIVYVYPMTGRPGTSLPDGWDDIPGARGCTPQSCAFRDHYSELQANGADAVFGLSTQSSDDQREAATRLHLPFPLLSDSTLALSHPLRLPTLRVDDKILLKRLTIIIDDGVIIKHFYPVFPPDKNASVVLSWLKDNTS